MSGYRPRLKIEATLFTLTYPAPTLLSSLKWDSPQSSGSTTCLLLQRTYATGSKFFVLGCPKGLGGKALSGIVANHNRGIRFSPLPRTPRENLTDAIGTGTLVAKPEPGADVVD